MTSPQNAILSFGLHPSSNVDKTDKQIIATALRLFVERGIKKTTIDDVAKAASIGRATLYRRFKDKESLIRTVLLDEAQQTLLQLEKKIQHIESPLDGLLEAFIQATLLGYRHPLYQTVMKSEQAYALPLLTQEIGPALQFASSYLALQISRAQQQGVMSALPANTTAEMLLRLMQSLLLTPDGMVTPKNEASLRLFADNYLRPLLTPLKNQK